MYNNTLMSIQLRGRPHVSIKESHKHCLLIYYINCDTRSII
jgi:hypothetical protein